jgi:hypothetical protein
MEKTKITFEVVPTNPSAKLGFETWLDDQLVFDTDHVQDLVKITVPVVDDESEHVLKMILKNKLPEHTQITATGEIESDSVLEIQNIAFDEIVLGQIVTQQTVYTHDVNGTGQMASHQFFGTMGCNGTVILKFTTPLYLLFLENM